MYYKIYIVRNIIVETEIYKTLNTVMRVDRY